MTYWDKKLTKLVQDNQIRHLDLQSCQTRPKDSGSSRPSRAQRLPPLSGRELPSQLSHQQAGRYKCPCYFRPRHRLHQRQDHSSPTKRDSRLCRQQSTKRNYGDLSWRDPLHRHHVCQQDPILPIYISFRRNLLNHRINLLVRRQKAHGINEKPTPTNPGLMWSNHGHEAILIRPSSRSTRDELILSL